VSVAARSRRARLPLPGGRAGATVVVHPMCTARMLVMPHFLQRPSGPLWLVRGMGLHVPRRRWTAVPIPAFLVEHPEAGALLVDTGLPAAAVERGARALGRAAALVATMEMEPGQAVADQLRGRGVHPADVRTVVLTHLHYDHTGSVAEFPHATFVVDGVEWRAARSRGPLRGYSRRQIDHPFDWREVDFADPAVTSFAGFGRTIDLFGDGSVRLLSTPGHSPGHMSLALRLSGGKELLIAADAAFARRSIDDELVPVLCEDVHLYLRSLREIRRHLELTAGAEVICGHDAESWPQVAERYA
jgi:N-acyl homoserine lactone hydrolase